MLLYPIPYDTKVATRLGKKTEAAASRTESSPLRRRIKTFGKAVVAAMSRESSSTSDTDFAPGRTATASSKLHVEGAGEGDEAVYGSGGTAPWGALPQSPGNQETVTTGMGSDFGVGSGDLSW